MAGQEAACVPYCGDPSPLLRRCRKQRCETDVCVGPRENVLCAAFVPQRVSDAINTFDCQPNEVIPSCSAQEWRRRGEIRWCVERVGASSKWISHRSGRSVRDSVCRVVDCRWRERDADSIRYSVGLFFLTSLSRSHRRRLLCCHQWVSVGYEG